MPNNTPSKPKIGIVGCGTMGASLAALFLAHGYDVNIVEISLRARETAQERIRREMRMMRLGTARAVHTQVVSPAYVSADFESLSSCKFVIESVTERLEVKGQVCAVIESMCDSDAILIANSSTLTVDAIAAWLRMPERLIGVHFMNPASVSKAAELISGARTSDAVVAEVERLLVDIGKEALPVRDIPGYVSNRLLMPFVNSAAWLVEKKLAMPASIDAVFEKCMGHAMGPLRTADLIGLDTVLDSILALEKQEPGLVGEVAPVLSDLVSCGDLGMKSGRGFHVYDHWLGQAASMRRSK